MTARSVLIGNPNKADIVRDGCPSRWICKARAAWRLSRRVLLSFFTDSCSDGAWLITTSLCSCNHAGWAIFYLMRRWIKILMLGCSSDYYAWGSLERWQVVKYRAVVRKRLRKPTENIVKKSLWRVSIPFPGVVEPILYYFQDPGIRQLRMQLEWIQGKERSFAARN